jgi:hypothetical protein
MTTNSTNISGQAYGNGTYVASFSPNDFGAGNTTAWQVFDRTLSTSPSTNAVYSAGGTSPYAGSTTTIDTFTSTSYSGAWVQLQLPSSILLQYYSLVGGQDLETRMPLIFQVFGSTNGTTWYLVDSRTGQTPWSSPQVFKIYNPTPSLAYSYFRFVANTLAGNWNAFTISEWLLYGASSVSLYSIGGNVGIGKTNPAYALDVTGDLNFTGTFRQNGTAYVGSQWTGTSALYFLGNVGINTTDVTNPLTVGGTLAATTFSGSGASLTSLPLNQFSGLSAGGVAYGSATTTIATNSAGTSGQALLSGGAGAPTWGTLGSVYGGTGADGSAVTANKVLASPNGSTGGVTYRALVSGDLPTVTFSPGSAGTYGSTTSIPTIVVDTYGRITGISTSSITTLSGLTTNGVLYASSATTAATTAVGTTGQPLLSGGIGASPTYGTLSVAYGGTGQTTEITGFNALSPMTTLGDLIYGAASGSGTRLAGSISATIAFLSQTGTGTVSAAPVWTLATGTGSVVLSASPTLSGTITGGTFAGTHTGDGSGVTNLNMGSAASGTLAIARGGTGLTSTSQNFVFSGPTSGSGAPSFRALVSGDVPTLNQNTTGSAGSLSTTLTSNYVLYGQNTGVPAFSSLLTWDGTTLKANDTGTSAGISGKRFYAAGVGDNTDTPTTSDNAGGPWYGLGYSVDTGLTNSVQLAGYAGLAFKTSTGLNVMDSTGRIGIGITNPSYSLDVNGTARIASSTLTLPTVLATTSVGVGTNASPPNKLSVLSTTAQLPSAVQISHPTGDWGLVIKRAANDTGSSNFAFLKSRGETSVIIAQGDSIGRISWHAVTNVTGPVVQHLAEINVTNTTFTGGNADGTMIFLTKQTTDSVPVERMRISPSGAVGIGIASPSDLLHILGTSSPSIRIDAGASATDPRLHFYSGATFRGRVAYSATGSYMYYQNDTQDVMRHYNGAGGAVVLQPISGKVGIGSQATSPGAYLQISTTDTSIPALSVSDASVDNGATYGLVNLTRLGDTVKAHLAFTRAGNYVWQMGYVSGTNTFGMFPWNFSGTQGVPVMSWTTGGYVGIGTTSPYWTLCSAYAGNNDSSTTDKLNFGAQIHNTTASGANNRPNLILFTDNNSTQGAMGGFRQIYNSNYLGGLVFYIGSQPVGYLQGTPTTTAAASRSLTEAMRINPNGNVGIGTNNPAKPLHVWGGMIIGASSDSRATTVTLNAPGATVTFSPNNDIGDGARIMCLQCPDLSSTTANLVSFSLQVAPTGSFGTQRTSLDLKAFRVASASYGGFCITSPFDVGGSYDLLYTDRTKAYFQQNLGIGTSSPSFKLHVSAGDSSFSYHGPNATWGASLKVGAGSTYAASGVASVVVTDGNLHIDSATNAKAIYLNFFQGGGTGGVNTTVGCYAAFTATGDITAFSSDERLKTKVGLIENALDKVCSLTAFRYTHNETARKNGFTDNNVYVGLSAQEVQKVLPEVVKPAPFDQGTEYDVGLGKSRSGENYLTVQYERIVSLLVEAVKEERAERLKVEERLARLEKLLLKE